jgi:hypothetical protein
LLIVKDHLFVHFLESLWLKQFALQLNPQIGFKALEKCFHGRFATKKFGKGRQEWMKTYIESKIQPRKLNTRVKIR